MFRYFKANIIWHLTYCHCKTDHLSPTGQFIMPGVATNGESVLLNCEDCDVSAHDWSSQPRVGSLSRIGILLKTKELNMENQANRSMW